MKSLKWLAVTGCVLLYGIGRAQAQDKPPAPNPPAAEAPKPEPPKVRPIDPAYEGLQGALKRIEKNEALQKAMQADASLYDKQAALEDKNVALALTELHDWLGQNTAPTQDISYSMDGPDPFFMLLGNLTQVAQLLQIKQYAALADGRVEEAIKTMREGLRLAVAIQNHGLIGCNAGFQIEDILVLPFARHLDQLAVRDCDRLMELALDWDRTPNAILFAMERERRGGILMMERLAGEEGKKLRDMLTNLPPDVVKPDSDEGKMIAQLRGLDMKGWRDLTVHLASGVDKIYTQAEEDLQTPYWKREVPPTAAPSPKDLVANAEGFLTAAMKPQLRKLESGYVTRQAYARMLGTHAAIRRFQWENNRLPASLKELKLVNLIRDPFTGNDLIYKVDKETYTLESAGAVVYGKDGKPDPAARKTITLLPKEPQASVAAVTDKK